MSEVADIVSKALEEEYNYNVKTGELPYCLVRTAAVFDPDARSILHVWNVKEKVNNRKSQDVLGLKYKSVNEGIVAMAFKVIDDGLVPNKRKSDNDQEGPITVPDKLNCC